MVWEKIYQFKNQSKYLIDQKIEMKYHLRRQIINKLISN